MRRLLILVLAVAAGFGGYWLYKNKDAQKLIGGAIDKMQNYPAAETPDKAAELFLKAIQERDYERAAAYCTKSYAEQLTAAAAGAKNLGGKIDGLMTKMEEFKIVNITECRVVLWFLDPFPKDGLAIVVTKDNDPNSTKAAATFAYTKMNVVGDRAPEAVPAGYRVNPSYVQSLYSGIAPGGRVAMVKDKQGDKVHWKFDFQVPGNVVQSVKLLKSPDCESLATQIKDLSSSINNDATVKEDFRRFFMEMINKWAS